MIRIAKARVDPNMMKNAEMHAHFTKLLVGRAHDVESRLGYIDSKLTDVMEKIDTIEKAFNTKLDAKFQEVMARLPISAMPLALRPHAHARQARPVPLPDQRTDDGVADIRD
jgi:hypothetical protein